MKSYRFVGTLADVGGVRLDRFGQKVQLPAADAKHERGPAVIPEERFAEIGFTDEELEKYAYPGPRTDAPSEFQKKLKAALEARHEYVYETRKVTPDPLPPSPALSVKPTPDAPTGGKK
jgi:hypothetical protein